MSYRNDTFWSEKIRLAYIWQIVFINHFESLWRWTNMVTFWLSFSIVQQRVIWYFSPYQTESRVCNSSNFLFNTHITPVKCIWNFWNDDNTNNWGKVMENFPICWNMIQRKKRNKSRVFIKKILHWNIGQETWKKNLIRLAWWDLYESADLAILSKNYYVTSLAQTHFFESTTSRVWLKNHWKMKIEHKFEQNQKFENMFEHMFEHNCVFF